VSLGARAVAATAVLVALAGAAAPAAEAQAPIRIGASLSLTGAYEALGRMFHRGYQLCVRRANEDGGILGRRLELLVEDDRSEATAAVRIYEKLITQTRVEAILGPYSSPITDAAAELAEKWRMPMVSPGAAATSVFKKGRKFVFQVVSPAEVYLEGPIDMAARRGLRTVALIHEDTLFPKAIAQGTLELAKRRRLSVVLVEAYPKGTTDFSALLTRIRAADPDVVAAGTYFEDAVALARQLKELDVNPRMFAVTVGGDLPEFYRRLGRTAEFVYGTAQWAPELVAVRAGGLIPIARQYPGAHEFVESYRREFPGTDLSYQAAGGYGACQVLVEAFRRAGSLDGEKLRVAIARMDLNTVYGAFKVNQDGVQIAHQMVMFQWQDGRKVIVWPDELAPGKPRFPTPPWSQRP
jgi:branched-chain amino acid transport system substrate-binding protein